MLGAYFAGRCRGTGGLETREPVTRAEWLLKMVLFDQGDGARRTRPVTRGIGSQDARGQRARRAATPIEMPSGLFLSNRPLQ